jgi:DNA-directed RNA polymerase specialized sigma24 family protein
MLTIRQRPATLFDGLGLHRTDFDGRILKTKFRMGRLSRRLARTSAGGHVAGWPIIERADDEWLVQSMRSGDGAAPGHLYDLYAVRLFDYCHVLLRDQEAAAHALLDSMIIMQERIGDLPDPGLFRGRLYTVTREQCLRRRTDAERHRAAEAGGSEADEATRRLVHSALLALSGRQREALDLSLRHGLAADELAEVLRTTPQDASTLIGQARHELDDAFAAVMVATTGRDDCPSVAALAGPPGAPLDAETCGRLSRHITSCPICGTRSERRLDATRLLNAMPFAAIPEGLRDRVLATASDPQFADVRATIAMRADLPAEPEPEEPRDSRRWPPVLAAVATGIVVIGGIWFALPGSHSKNTGDDQAAASNPGATAPSGDPSASDSGGPLPSDDVTSPSPTPSTSSGTPTPTPTPGAKNSKHPHPRPSTPSSPASAPAPPPPAPPGPPAPGTLAVYGCTMNGSRSCTVTVVAQGGPVDWRVTGTHGSIRASGSGSLSAGQSAGVTATLTATLCLGSGSGSVSFSSGATANVDYHC